MDWICRFPFERYPTITLAHGGGGRLTQQLIDDIFKPAFDSDCLNDATDCANLFLDSSNLCFATDSFVVNPIFFRGGDIGKLAVTGTCNDLAMGGAEPRWLSVGFILEEGLAIKDFVRIVESMAQAAREIGVKVVAGDTKVVERGKGDGIYINVSGIGIPPSKKAFVPKNILAGDVIVLSGPVGRHGISIMADRANLGFESSIQSDCSHLWPRVEELLRSNVEVHVMRDLTRGGLATALIELAQTRVLEMKIQEKMIAVDSSVSGACEMLGLDPLFCANEGTMVAIVPNSAVAGCLKILKEFDPSASAIGTVGENSVGRLLLETEFGTTYSLEKQSGEQLPRIC